MKTVAATSALDVYQTALLAQGLNGPCDAAIVALVARELLRVDLRANGFGRFYAEGVLPADAHCIERTVHEAAAQPHAPLLFEALHDWETRVYRTREQAGKLSRRQVERGRRREAEGPGMLPQPGATYRNLCHALRPDATEMRQDLAQLGLLRAARLGRSRRTPAGQEMIDELNGRHVAMRSSRQYDTDPVLAVALWGVATLEGTPLAVVHEAICGDQDLSFS
jgi:hypothetical protein